YEMLSGTVPFDDASTPAILIKHIKEFPEPPSMKNPRAGIPPPLEAVAMRCLEKDPARRFQTADEFASALEQAAGSVPSVAAAMQPTVPIAAAVPMGSPTVAGGSSGVGLGAAAQAAGGAQGATAQPRSETRPTVEAASAGATNASATGGSPRASAFIAL